MKKCISLVLCLAMVISLFSTFGVTASAVSGSDLFTVETSGIKNDKITYTVYLNKGVGVSGAIIFAKFDADHLKVVESSSGAYMVSDGDGGKRENIGGLYESGLMAGYKNRYSVAHANIGSVDYKSNASKKPYMKFTFKVISKTRPKTSVSFYCYEFSSQSKSSNNIKNGSNKFISKDTRITLGSTKLSSLTSGEGGMKISWNKTTGADGYYVYKKVDGAFKKIATVKGGSKTSYTDKTGVKNGKSYTYTVRAYNGAGKGYTFDKTGLTAKYIAAPSKVTAKIQEGLVTVSWSKVSGADSYRLYRRVISDDGTKKSWKAFDKTKSLKMTDTSKSLKSGTKYEYAVRAYSGSRYSGLYSSTTVSYLGVPKIKAKAVYDGVQISWGKVDGAEKYKIYRKVDGTSKWVAVKTVSKKSLSYTDTKAPNNTKIYYIVKAVNGSTSSAYESVSVDFLKAPVAKFATGKNGIKISWNKISGATEYHLYRKGDGETKWVKIARVTTNTYTDTEVKNNVKYVYTLKASNSKMTSNFNSDGWGVTYLTAPELVSVSSSEGGITFKWKKVKGAEGYIIYRKGETGSYEEIARTAASMVSFLDPTTEKDALYTYTVRAYNDSFTSYYRTGLKITDEY